MMAEDFFRRQGDKDCRRVLDMSRAKGRSRGFTLIASLLVLALLSAIAVSLLFMVQARARLEAMISRPTGPITAPNPAWSC